jgi:hypothetical protein
MIAYFRVNAGKRTLILSTDAQLPLIRPVRVQIVRTRNKVEMIVGDRRYTGSFQGWTNVDVNGNSFLGLGTASAFGSTALFNKA